MRLGARTAVRVTAILSFRYGVALQPLRSHCSLPFSDGCSQTWTLRFLPYVDSLSSAMAFIIELNEPYCVRRCVHLLGG